MQRALLREAIRGRILPSIVRSGLRLYPVSARCRSDSAKDDTLSVEYRPLGNTGMELSLISMGGSGYGNVYGQIDEAQSLDSVHYAIDRGINYIDTAYWYGQGSSELFLGKALKDIPREKYYIATKVGRYEPDARNRFNFSAEKVTQSAEESLKRMELDYVDLLQVHDVEFAHDMEFAPSVDVIVNETLPAVNRLQERGLCRFIGITGYPIKALREVLERSPVKIDSVLSYCRLTVWDPSLTEHFSYFQSKGIPLINASPIGMGLLATAPLQSWHPASDDIKEACANAVKYCEAEGVDISHLAVKYSASFKEVTTTLVSMCDRSTVDRNIEAAMRPLTLKEQTVMDEIIRRYFTPLQLTHWEGVEYQEYKRQLQDLELDT